MLSPKILEGQQISFIHEVHADDDYLLNIIEGEWFEILYYFQWEHYRGHAAAYYDALYEFNTKERQTSSIESEHPGETKEQAKQRLLFERATMQSTQGQAPIIYQGNIIEFKEPKVDPLSIAPGVVPNRLAGRKPKCFFSLLKAFIGTNLMGYVAEPEQVHQQLKNNPSFARVCGFMAKEKDKTGQYRAQHVPELRKIEQFDQVMRQAGLWEKIKVTEIQTNLSRGIITPENELVGDTTHYHAYSSFETVHYENATGNVEKKSQAKTNKACRCQDRDSCPHDWQLADDGAGTVVKSRTKMYWGHKASIIGLPKQGVAIDAVAIMDAATHDGQTFYPHVQKVFEQYPEIGHSTKCVLYDSACDDAKLKLKFKKGLGVELKASLNPRRSQPVTDNLPRGIEKITPYGVPICLAGHEFEYKGIRYANETFIYAAPQTLDGLSVCQHCDQRDLCCNQSNQAGRTITVSFDTLPHIDHNDPPMAKRFKAIMRRRPSVERMIKRLKCDLGDDRLSKRGNESFQAYLDKTMIAYHMLIRHLH